MRPRERVGRPPHAVAVCLIGRQHITSCGGAKRRDRLCVSPRASSAKPSARGRREERFHAGLFFDDPEAHEMSGDGHGPLTGAAFLIGDNEPERRPRFVWPAGACQLAGEQVRTHDVGGIERQCFLQRSNGRRGAGRGRIAGGQAEQRERVGALRIECRRGREFAQRVGDTVAVEVNAAQRQMRQRRQLGLESPGLGRDTCLVGANGLVPCCETPIHGLEARKDARPFVAVSAVEREAELRERVGEAGLRIGNLAGRSIRDGQQYYKQTRENQVQFHLEHRL